MRISSNNEVRRNEHSYTMLVGINVNWNNLSRKHKYVTEVLKLFILSDPAIAFLEILINIPNCCQIFMPNDIHCNVICNRKKDGKIARFPPITKWLE